ncbi:MAG: fasciclin domain-containing protein [Crocosphaera sp.]|nr:fasciclin domain-containing protein [Crocosphaera sp.]
MIKQFTLTKALKSTSLLTGLLMATFCSLSPAIADGHTEMSDKHMETEVMESSQEKMNLVETAMGAGEFNTLVAAVKAAGLVETLSGDGKFTVFAPTDKAFAALGEDTLNELLKPENKDQLIAILTYHVVSGVVESSDLESGEVKTVEGSPVKIKLGEAVKVNEAVVIKADIKASNGIIHVIDTVMLPPKK